MRKLAGVMAMALVPGLVAAEVRDEAFEAGDQLVRIEALGTSELMWVGAKDAEGLLVLTGADIEITAEFTDDEALQMLGVRALVAVVPGTHSCENLDDPRDYYVVTLGEALATDGPLTTCVELTVSATPGQIVLEEDPMRDGEYYFWVPGQGFGGAAN